MGDQKALDSVVRKSNEMAAYVCIPCVNEDGIEVPIVHLLPNADAMDHLLQDASERAKGAYEFIESDRPEIYGTPSDGALEMMKKIAESGIGLNVNPQPLGGFIRRKFE